MLWDQNISTLRATVNNQVLTNEARNGIVRYWEGWVARGGDATTNPTCHRAAAANPPHHVCRLRRKAPRPALWPDGTPYTGRLVCFSVFGSAKLDGTPFSPELSKWRRQCRQSLHRSRDDAPGAVWDKKRPTRFNTGGYFAKVLAGMPQPNNFDDSGDGLIRGIDRWLRTRRTGDPAFYNETLVGNDPYSNRKQINIKSITTIQSTASTVDGPINGTTTLFRGEWQNGVRGNSYRRPHIFTCK